MSQVLSAVVLRAAETSLKRQSEAQLDLLHISFFFCQVVKVAWFPFFSPFFLQAFWSTAQEQSDRLTKTEVLQNDKNKIGCWSRLDVIIRGFTSTDVEVNNPSAKSNYTHAKLYVTVTGDSVFRGQFTNLNNSENALYSSHSVEGKIDGKQALSDRFISRHFALCYFGQPVDHGKLRPPGVKVDHDTKSLQNQMCMCVCVSLPVFGSWRH